MLSRVADSLFWMSRSIERAENVARMLDVSFDLLMDLGPMEEPQVQRHWQDLLSAMGEEEQFASIHPRVDAFHVLDFLTLNTSNPHSIFSCIRLARENARTVREQISSEMWEQLNRLFLFSKDATTDRIWQEGPHRFYQAIKEGAQAFHGVTDSTMTHGEGWEFIRVGKFLERADKTTRLVDIRHTLLQPPPNRAPRPTDVVEWMAVLKSCSGLEAYRKAFSSSVQPERIVRFLLYHDSFPRSVRFSINQIAEALWNITPVPHGQFSNSAQMLAGRLRADIDFCDPNEVFNQGLHQYLDGLQIRFNQLGEDLSRCYLTQSQYPPGQLESVQQQQQQ